VERGPFCFLKPQEQHFEPSERNHCHPQGPEPHGSNAPQKTARHALSASTLPLAAQALALTNSGLDNEGNTYADTTEVTGSLSNQNVQPMQFYSDTLNHDQVLNTQMQVTGDDLNGIDLSYAGDYDNPSSIDAPTEVFSNLQNKGSITVNGAGVTGLLIDPATIHGLIVLAFAWLAWITQRRFVEAKSSGIPK
jgi:hypothetical protein